MNKVNINTKIKLFFEKLKLNPKKHYDSNITYDRTISESNGFQLNFGDLDEWTVKRLKDGFYTEETLNNMINNTNNTGYIPEELGEELVALIKNQNVNTYIKTIHSTDLESIFDEGIRCLGNSTRGFNNVPKETNEVFIGDSIQVVPEIIQLFSIIKSAYGTNQGGNIIDGTLIIQIPNNATKDEIIYFNESTNTFNIKPEFIKCFVSTTENKIVSEMIHNDKKKTI